MQFSYISFILIFLAGFPMLVYLAVKYFGKGEPYGDYAVILLTLGFSGIIGILIINRSRIFIFQTYWLETVNRLIWFVIFVCGVIICLGIAWFILGSTLKFGLSATELYFYYIGTAIMEEVFFRMFLCGGLKNIFNRSKKQLPDIAENFIIAGITATIFMLAHLSTYGSEPMALVIMFAGGIIFALFYLFTKDISITIIAHVIVNAISVGSLLMSI